MSPRRELGARDWEDVCRGHHLAVLGATTIDPPSSWQALVVRVRCERGAAPLAPITEARHFMQRLLGETVTGPELAPAPLRRHLLPEALPTANSDAFVDLCERVSAEAPGGAALLFESVDRADDASLAFLRRAVLGRRGLGIAMVVTFESNEPGGAAARFLDAIRAASGHVVAAPDGRRLGSRAGDLPPLEPRVLRTLRIGALLESPFAAHTVAQMMGIPELEVLEHLQSAADAGIPVEDDGAMRFRLPTTVVEALRGSMLTSLVLARRRQMARRPESDDAGTQPQPPLRYASTLPATPSARRVQRPSDGAPAEPERPAHDDPDPLLEVEHDLGVSRAAEELGAYGTAVAALRRALAHAREAPDSAGTRRVTAHLHLELGRILWRAAGPEHDFSLPAALDAAQAAKDLLCETDPLEMRTRASVLIANICYDLGDAPSLARALAELAEAHQRLFRAGDTIGAARLLNDQAAVHVRLGDPLRALALMQRSRTVFAERADKLDASALLEQAETDHLMARVPLHVAPSHERAAAVAADAMRAARSAEAAYRRFRASRELARVWETMGRLEMLAGRPEAALGQLMSAARSQRQAADAIGLARSSAAIAQALATCGDHLQAAAWLSESVELNLAKRSPMGLAFNRRSYDELAAAAARDSQANDALRVLGDRLQEAELEVDKSRHSDEVPREAWALH